MKKERKGVRSGIALVACLLLTLVVAFPAAAEEEVPYADASVWFGSKYVWRGLELSKDSLVIQPTITVGYYGFYVNLWGNLDTDPYVPDGVSDDGVEKQWNETDLTLAYGSQFGPVFFEVGYLYYALDGIDDSQEVFASVGIDIPLSPTFTVYREIDNYEHWYFRFDVSYSFGINEYISIDLGASFSWLQSEDEEAYPEFDENLVATGEKYSDFRDGTVTLSIPITVGYFYMIPSVSYVYQLTDDSKYLTKAFALEPSDPDENFFFGGVTFGFAF